jgi:hypothetical protein
MLDKLIHVNKYQLSPMTRKKGFIRILPEVWFVEYGAICPPSLMEEQEIPCKRHSYYSKEHAAVQQQNVG